MGTNQEQSEINYIQSIHQIIFNLENENIESSVQTTMQYFDQSTPISFNYIICHCIYSSFVSQIKDTMIYINYLKALETKEEHILNKNPQIFNIFEQYLKTKNIYTGESNYLLAELKEAGLIKMDFFIHGYDMNLFKILKEKNFEEAKRYINKKYSNNNRNFIEIPSDISIIIQNDDVEKLQEIASQPNFDYNQNIKQYVYEKGIVNDGNTSLINYSAFYGSIKCFKFLMLNGSNLTDVGKYAVAGGNIEMVHLCEKNIIKIKELFEVAIEFTRNDIFHYLYDKNPEEINENNLNDLCIICIQSDNYEIFSFLIEKGLKINNKVISAIITCGNLYILKYAIKGKEFPKESLINSVISKNIELVEYILKQNVIDINEKDEYGQTALMIASQKGDIEIVQLLLEQEGIDINAKDKNGYTALIRSSENNNIEIVKLLLEQKGIDINAKEGLGRTALIFAVTKGIELVKLLINKGIDINAVDLNHQTAISVSLSTNQINVFKLLLEQKGINLNDKNKSGKTILMDALSHIKINKTEFNKKEIVKLLLKNKGIDVNIKDNNGHTALYYGMGATNEKIEIFKEFLESNKFDIYAKDNDGETPFMYASRNGYTEIVKLLLENAKIDLNEKDNKGKTALILACEYGKTEMVKLLLEQEGIDINAQDNEGKTVLMYATFCKKEIVTLLLKQEGIDINAKDNNGETALMYAFQDDKFRMIIFSSDVKKLRIEILQLLLQQKDIDVNAKDKSGQTALIKASKIGKKDVVKILLKQKGIDINAQDNQEMTAILRASEYNKNDVVKLLKRQKGIKYNEDKLNEVRKVNPMNYGFGFGFNKGF